MKSLIATLALSLIGGAANAQDIKLCHIANSGFMAEGRNSAVLFDAVRLKDTFDGDYAMPRKKLTGKMISGEAPFDKVTVALVSHNHNDHFDPVGTLRHLRKNKSVRYVMPPEAFEMLKAGKARPEDLARVNVVLPSEDAGPITQQIGDVTIEAYRVSHGEGGPQNIGYRVSLDGVRIFHTGDIAADKKSLRRAGLRHTEVDIMLMPFWYGLNNAEQSEAAAFAWQIDTVVPMHFAPKEEKWMKEYGGFDMLVKHVHDQWPKSRKVLGEMKCERFSY
ncbi:MBL fold metallo-hydrolase [Kordiimonas gwangyangensis]|uniref:MBL fold metallo-hydrolase n=1 Tax=Kordiimonas gwangyangensis TaxID=288022 RepID=UPI00035CCE5B|nr:MBL fold metallo-hydrolase [Kordiimonas gwangyangensis]